MCMCVFVHIILNVDTIKNKFKIWFVFKGSFAYLNDLASNRNGYLNGLSIYKEYYNLYKVFFLRHKKIIS